MAADLIEKQFELGGVVFGWGCRVDLQPRGWQPGAAAMRKQRTDIPGGDGVRMGIDRYGGATWVFEGFTNLDSEEEAWDAVEEIAGPWSGDEVRGIPSEVMALRYRMAGEVRRIYGRPGRFTPVIDETFHSGNIKIVADFDTVDHLVYEDAVNTASMPLTPPLDPEAGLEVPFIPPFTTGVNAGQTQSQITVGGKVATPLTLTIEGEGTGLTDARVQIGDAIVQLDDIILPDDPVTIDAHPWANSALRQSGGAVKMNSRVTRISRMRVPPGTHSVIFGGTGAGSLTVSWRNARRSPR